MIQHGDVIKWKKFPRYWPFVRGIHWSPVDSLHKGQWRGALMLYLMCAWSNDWVNSLDAGDLRRHGAHCDVIVMGTTKMHWLLSKVVNDIYCVSWSEARQVLWKTSKIWITTPNWWLNYWHRVVKFSSHICGVIETCFGIDYDNPYTYMGRSGLMAQYSTSSCQTLYVGKRFHCLSLGYCIKVPLVSVVIVSTNVL